jgi:hypothetical protein
MNPPTFDEFLFNDLENCQGNMLRALISLNQTPAPTPTDNQRQQAEKQYGEPVAEYEQHVIGVVHKERSCND